MNRSKGSEKMSERKSLYLVCNAHLDPVWLWEWQEGAAEAMSTFRTAADLCEEFDGFVFNHNEAILYRWIEEYEPSLFERIQRLVKEGRWHIMGGWHVQPDCNMPSGESIVRQILSGRRYFEEKFGARPTTAINFDPFGHSRGLAQIMAKAGYDSYLFCRPGDNDCPLPSNLFRWVGFDGSSVTGYRALAFYGSALGKVEEKVKGYIDNFGYEPIGLCLWGVGNHGGGPSRKDLSTLARMIGEPSDRHMMHATPEQFFEEVRQSGIELPAVEKPIIPWAVGCYTSQIRVKQRHRELENELFSTEKMATAAWMQGVMDYPRQELEQAQRDLLTCEFHDILPGSSIQPAEEASLRMLDHGLEILSRVKARAFFALSSGQKKAANGQIPVLVYNPHPFELSAVVECEFQMPDANWTGTFTNVTALQNGKPLPTQVEKELSSIPIDWRKRVVFRATLKPGQMNRFDCRLEPPQEARREVKLKAKGGKFLFQNEELEVSINARTGLMDRYRVRGVDYLKSKAFQPLVMADNEDPWGMTVRSFRDEVGAFSLLSGEQSAAFSGIKGESLQSVRVVEEGPVRTVVEAVLGWNHSFVVLTYKLPAQGSEVEVHVRVFWNEKDRMLKLSIPTSDAQSCYTGQVMYGQEELFSDGTECVAQKWTGALSEKTNRAVTVINDGIYGSDFSKGEIRLSLLRSAGYSAHPIGDRQILPQDRFMPRIDQGERQYRFWLNAGEVKPRLEAVNREALVRNEKPMTLSFSPSGQGKALLPAARLSDKAVLLTTMKAAEGGEDVIVRLFEPTGTKRQTTLELPACGMKLKVALNPFEIATLRVSPSAQTSTRCNLLEEPLG